MPFAFESDFDITPSGSFREATTVEVIRQDIVHLLLEMDDLGESSTAVFIEEIKGQMIQLLGSHPAVSTIDQINVQANSDNTVNIDLYLNGNPLAINLTTGGR